MIKCRPPICRTSLCHAAISSSFSWPHNFPLLLLLLFLLLLLPICLMNLLLHYFLLSSRNAMLHSQNRDCMSKVKREGEKSESRVDTLKKMLRSFEFCRAWNFECVNFWYRAKQFCIKKYSFLREQISQT
jgi:hypothetical protein